MSKPGNAAPFITVTMQVPLSQSQCTSLYHSHNTGPFITVTMQVPLSHSQCRSLYHGHNAGPFITVTISCFVSAVGAKAPRKQVGASSSVGSPTGSGAGGSKNKNSGGNPVKWWPSPKWQKGKLPLSNNYYIVKIIRKTFSG